MIEVGLRNYLLADSNITGATGMGTYTRGGVTKAAIFTGKIPENASNVSILINHVSGIPWGTKAQKGAEVIVDIEVHGDNLQSEKNMRNIAELVWKRVHRGTPTVSGYQVVGCWANYPAHLEFEGGFPGFIIQARVIVLEE